MGTKTKILGLIVAAVMTTAPVMVWADNGPGDQDPSHQDGDWHHQGGWHHGDMEHMFAKVLGLTETQVKQLKDSQQKQREAMKALFEQIKSNREQLNAEIIKATPDMATVNTIETQLKALQSQMVDDQLNSILEVKKVLTPEQFIGYMALKKEKKMMMHHMMGHDKFGHKPWGDRANDGDKDHDQDGQND